jgi:hypothetical protein
LAALRAGRADWHTGCFVRGRVDRLEPGLADTSMGLMGRTVLFAIHDIEFPSPESVLVSLHGHDLLRGEVVDVSESTSDHQAFVVVKVERVDQPVVVPLDRILD